MKIGLFGGSFNPVHKGHINSVKTVKESFDLDIIKLIPNYQSPHPKSETPLRAYQRIEMLKAALPEMGKNVEIDECEVNRGGMSFSVDTVKHFFNAMPGSDIYLIIGADQFEVFHLWKDYESIIDKSNLIVTTRPGYELPKDKNDLPEELAEYCHEFSGKTIQLKTGKEIQFLALEDIDVSSTYIKEQIRANKDVSANLPMPVVNVIKANNYYTEKQSLVDDYLELAQYCGQLLFDRKAMGVLGKSFEGLDAASEYAVIGSGTSTKHASAMANFVKSQVKSKYGISPIRIDGLPDANWVILDYGALLVHVFYDITRHEFKIEELWQQAEDLKLADSEI